MQTQARWRQALDSRAIEDAWLILPVLAGRMLLALLPIAAFAVVAYVALSLADPGATARLVTLAVVNAAIVAGAVIALARVLLAARLRDRLLLRLGEETAAYALIWVRRLTYVAVYGYFLSEAALLLGLPYRAYVSLSRLVGLLEAVLLIILVMQSRTAVAQGLRREAGGGLWTGLRERLADVWHILAIAYVVVIYLVWALGIAGGFAYLVRATILTIVVLMLARLVNGAIRSTAERGSAPDPDLGERHHGLETRADRYRPLLQRALSAIVYLVALVALLEAWGLGVFAWLGGDFGRRLAESAVTIGLILVAALILSEAANTLIERYLRRKSGDDSKRSARLRTLLPLIRNAFRIFLFVMAALIVLSELGLNIAPLLAGAGVVGLAIGFGAQTLVKDVITGVFMLAEDTVAVGDVVDLGGPSGVVEAMTIRSIRLRDGSGTVITVPFSAVTTVKNMTRDFSYAVFRISVGYSEDIDRVIKVLQEIGAELQADPAFGWRILAPIEIQGLDQFGDSAIIIQARIKTRPIQQWDIMREFNRRMKQRFDREGIEIPFPQRTIHYRIETTGQPQMPAQGLPPAPAD